MSNDESSPLKRALMSICPVLPSMPTSLSDNSRPPIPAASSSTASAEDLRRGTFRSKRVCRMSGSPRTEASAMSHVPSPICMLLTLAVKSATTPATSTLTLLKSVCQPRQLGGKIGDVVRRDGRIAQRAVDAHLADEVLVLGPRIARQRDVGNLDVRTARHDRDVLRNPCSRWSGRTARRSGRGRSRCARAPRGFRWWCRWTARRW